ncbi:MAG: sensor histidine kinase [Chloroflexota bacterium]|nr:sensor histidine kinase [Chloroflexota bacterium]
MATTFTKDQPYNRQPPESAVTGPPARTGPPWLRAVNRLPLLVKVLIANAMIVVLGAVAGTRTTMILTRSLAEGTAIPLVLAFAGLGVILSLLVNYVVLRAAFRPLTNLERVAEAVQLGDLTARADPIPGGDPQLAHLATTFNRTLDELERDRAELRAMASQVINAQEEERKRIARELHDDTAQILFAQLLRLTALQTSPNDETRATAADLEEMTVEALEGVRRLALELRPPALDDLGLHAALADLAQRFGEQLGIPVEITTRGPRGRLPGEVELVLYRVAQEALTNVAKHAAASRVGIDLERQAADVTLAVEDDGIGFDPKQETARDGRGLGLGLFGMAERVSLVGGTCSIWSQPGRGTEIFAFIPLAQARGSTTAPGPS